MSADSPIVFRWAASSFFGWGVYGLNLALHWAGDPAIESLAAWSVFPREARDVYRELHKTGV